MQQQNDGDEEDGDPDLDTEEKFLTLDDVPEGLLTRAVFTAMICLFEP